MLDGLGNINTNNASATVSTPYGYLNKTAEDNRKLEVNFSKFKSNEEYGQYLLNWFTQSCGFNASMSNDVEPETLEGIPAIYLSMMLTNSMALTYKVYCIQNSSDLQMFLAPLNIFASGKTVLMGNYTASKLSQTERQLKQNNIECFSLEDIYDVNNAIDLADKKLPYIGTGGSKLSTLLAKVLNNRYKANAQGGMVDTNEIKSELNSLGEAFKSGFNQLKDSINDMIGSVKGMTNNPNQQPVQQQKLEQQQDEWDNTQW